MPKVWIENKKGSMEKGVVDYGIFLGGINKEMITTVVGESTFEEMNNLLYSGIKHLYESAVTNFGEKTRKEIYERAVQMFSLVMDEFYPEGKDQKYGVLTDEDIAKAEEKKIATLSKQK